MQKKSSFTALCTNKSCMELWWQKSMQFLTLHSNDTDDKYETTLSFLNLLDT